MKIKQPVNWETPYWVKNFTDWVMEEHEWPEDLLTFEEQCQAGFREHPAKTMAKQMKGADFPF